MHNSEKGGGLQHAEIGSKYTNCQGKLIGTVFMLLFVWIQLLFKQYTGQYYTYSAFLFCFSTLFEEILGQPPVIE